MANEFVARNGIIAKDNSTITGTLAVSGNITMGGLLVATQSWVTTRGYATESYVTTAINDLIGSAPGALNTLNELAAALGDDPNFATTITTSIGSKVAKAGDTMTGELVFSMSAPQIRFADIDHYDHWIHVNSNRFYILSDRNGDGTWETPYPLELNSENNTGYVFSEVIATRPWVTSQGYLTTYENNYVSEVALNGSNLRFTGEGSGFTGDIDLSTLPFAPQGSYLTAEADTLATVTGRGATTNTAVNFGANGGAVNLTGLGSHMSFKDQDNVWTGYVGFDGNIGRLEFPGRNVRIGAGYNGTIELNNGTADYNSGTVSIPWGNLSVGAGKIYSGNKNAIDGSYDSWLRLNNTGDYTSGVYTPAGLRNDGAFINYGGIYGYANIQARKAQTAGDYTTAALWTESYDNTATGIAFHISGNVGKFLEMRTDGILYWEGAPLPTQAWVQSQGYLTSETDSQTLDWNQGEKTLTISNGNTVTLDGLTTEDFVTSQGYITGYTETDTLATVTARGATTSVNNVQFNDGATLRRNSASGQNIHTYVVNNGGGYSSAIYIGANPGADWLIGKDAYGAGSDKFQIGSWNGYAYIEIAYDATAGTINFPNNGGLSVNNNTIWHAGNDGSGSGLDADLLDGYQPSTSSTANTIALRDSIGDISAREFVLTASTIHTTTPSSIVGIFPTTNQVVKFADTAVRTFLNVPTRTGGDASGTWGINITGSAGYATSSGNSVSTDQTNFSELFIEGNAVATEDFVTSQGYITSNNATGANGNFYIDDNYGYGIVGAYSATRYQGIWAMGDSYKLPGDGVGSGSLYGLAWSYNPDYSYSGSNAQSKPGLNHQLLLMMNGETHTALGSGIWTNGLITTVNHGTSANWNTAYGWGNHASAGYQAASTAITTSNIGSQSVATSTQTYRVIVEDTRSGQRTPDDYDDYRASWEFTNQIPGLSGSTWWSLMTVQGWHDAYSAWQIIGPSEDGPENWYLRVGNNTTWGTARRIWHAGDFSSTNVTNWNTAFGWGNHADQSYATQTYVNTAVSNLVDAAPGTLDTLNELAAALGDDPNFATTVTNSIAGKVSKSGDTMTGNLTTTGLTVGNGVATGRQPYGPLANANIVLNSSTGDSSGVCGIEFLSGNNYPSDGATIYFQNNAGGNSERAKLTLRVENDQEDFIELRAGKVVINANTYSAGGQNPAVVFQHNDTQIASITSGGQIDASGGNSSQWNTAYGWGNHADYGYWVLDNTEPKNVQANEVIFAGNVTVEGTFTESSSIRFKENIVDLESSTEKVEQLRPVRYNKIGVEEEEIGLIAEEVAEIYPEVVTYNEEGQPSGVNYTRLSVILLKSVQELAERINKLENK